MTHPPWYHRATVMTRMHQSTNTITYYRVNISRVMLIDNRLLNEFSARRRCERRGSRGRTKCSLRPATSEWSSCARRRVTPSRDPFNTKSRRPLFVPRMTQRQLRSAARAGVVASVVRETGDFAGPSVERKWRSMILRSLGNVAHFLIIDRTKMVPWFLGYRFSIERKVK